MEKWQEAKKLKNLSGTNIANSVSKKVEVLTLALSAMTLITVAVSIGYIFTEVSAEKKVFTYTSDGKLNELKINNHGN